MRKINITIDIEDDDFTEHRLKSELNILLGASMVDYKVLTNTQKMYQEDKSFKKIIDKYREAKRVRDVYINENNHKYK